MRAVILVLLVVLLALLASTHAISASLSRDGWLVLHQCAHMDKPNIRGDNLVNNVGSYPPVSASDNANTKLQAVFSRGPNGDVLAKYQLTNRHRWSDWLSLGSPSTANGNGAVKSDPVAVSDVNSLLVVFILGADGNLYMRRQVSGTTSTFGNWTMVSSPTPAGTNTRDPVAILSKNNRIFVYVVSNDYVYEAKETTAGIGQFTEWYGVDTGMKLKGRFSVVLNQWTGWIEGFAILQDNKLYQAWQLWSEKWHGFRKLWLIQPSNPSDPAVHGMTGSAFHGMLELFVVDGNGQTWHTWQTTCDGVDNPWSQCTWGAYYKIGSSVPLRAIAASTASSFMDTSTTTMPMLLDTSTISLQITRNLHGGNEVFITGTDGNLWHMWQVAMWGSWSNWENLGHPQSGPLTSPPALVHDQSGWWLAYCRGQLGSLEIYVQDRSISLSTDVVHVNGGVPGALTVSWSVPVDEAMNDDWIGIYPVNQTDNAKYLDFMFVGGAQEPGRNPLPTGSTTFQIALPSGLYEARYLVNHRPVAVLHSVFKVATDNSGMNPVELFFVGMTVGLGQQAVNFGQCVSDFNTTFYTFDKAFASFAHAQIIQGLNLLGEGLKQFSTALTVCGQTSIAKSMDKFITDLIACVESDCNAFIIDQLEDVFIVGYLRTHEIFGDIQASSNAWRVKAWEESGLDLGRVVAAVIAPVQ